MNCQHIGDESNTAVSGRDGRQQILPEQQRTKQQRRSETTFEKMGADRRYLRQFGAPAIDVGLIEVALAGASDLGCQMAVLLGQIGVTPCPFGDAEHQRQRAGQAGDGGQPGAPLVAHQGCDRGGAGHHGDELAQPVGGTVEFLALTVVQLRQLGALAACRT